MSGTWCGCGGLRGNGVCLVFPPRPAWVGLSCPSSVVSAWVLWFVWVVATVKETTTMLHLSHRHALWTLGGEKEEKTQKQTLQQQGRSEGGGGGKEK